MRLYKEVRLDIARRGARYTSYRKRDFAGRKYLMKGILQTKPTERTSVEARGAVSAQGRRFAQAEKSCVLPGVPNNTQEALKSVPSADSSRLYRDEIGRVSMLSDDEVLSLALRIERGKIAAQAPRQPGNRELIEDGERAKRTLIEANLRLVIHVARRYRGLDMDLMDLVQEGNLGLIHAVEKYDYRKGYKFSTYAIWWIRQAITRALTEQAQMIRVPLYKMEKIKRLTKARQNLEQGLEKEPTLEDLAEGMDVSVEQVIDLLMMVQAQDPLSLDIKRRVGEDEVPLSDLLEDDQVNSPERIVIAQTLEVLIRELLNDLTPRERSVSRLRYGRDDGHEHTLNEVGRKLGLSHEAVRQIECRALKKLDPLSRKRKLEEFLA